MSAASVLDRVDAEARTQRHRSEQSYLLLVDSLADGEDIEPAVVLEATQEAGRTPDRLRADVTRLVERRRLAALVETQPTVEAERNKAQAQVEALMRERDAQVAKFNAKIAQASGVAEAAIIQLRHIKSARQQLISGAPPELKSHLESLRQRQAELEADIARHRAEIDRLAPIAARPVPEPRDESRRPYGNELLAERGRRDEAKAIADARHSHKYAADGIALAKRFLTDAEVALARVGEQILVAQAQLLAP